MNENKLREAFVSNLNGTTITEISVGLTVAPVCILCRGLILILHHQKYSGRCSSWNFYFLLDFLLLILPQVLSCTILCDYLYLVPLVILAVCVALFGFIYRGRKDYSKISFDTVCKSLLKAPMENETVPSVTTLRVFVNMLTAIAILAVDFPVFPRRYAKTETYGTGVMDVGVGGFVFGNALVSPEARLRNVDPSSKFSRLKKQCLSVWPLLVLGFGRLISVKSVDYHEHVSEYGVHWNFFFTLAIVKILASLLLAKFPAHTSWLMGTIIIFCYQLFLERTNLKSFVLHGSDGRGTRAGFLNANREGLFSVIGYLVIYMAGVQVGLYIMEKRHFCKDWIKAICNLLLMVSLLFMIFYVFNVYVAPVSRRVANVTFCIWIVAQCLFWLCLILLSDLVLMFSQYLVTGSKVPSTWKACTSLDSSTMRDRAKKEGSQKIDLCLINAVNRNQLLFFLQSNVLTGMVNMMTDTIHSSNVFSLAVLLIYMFSNCLIIYILHLKNITIKFW
ncbi:glucosaminyl-phosphatidylinositol-acyltransferase PIGW [Pelodytes ibericus]